MTRYTLPIAIERQDGQYRAYGDDPRGVDGLGETIEGAKTSMLEGIRLYVVECKRAGYPIGSPKMIYSELFP